ncbi:hypothetical protein Landi51_08650, partial [Colletotrichum acutatum]
GSWPNKKNPSQGQPAFEREGLRSRWGFSKPLPGCYCTMASGRDADSDGVNGRTADCQSPMDTTYDDGVSQGPKGQRHLAFPNHAHLGCSSANEGQGQIRPVERCHQTEHSSPQGPQSKAWPHRYIDMGEMGNMPPRAESEARPHIHCAELIQAKQKT